MAALVVWWHEPKLAILVHLGTLVIGHLNHANWDLGPLSICSIHPPCICFTKSHLARGVNFGLSLSCWDYLFHTAAEPTVSGDVRWGLREWKKSPSILLNSWFMALMG